MVGMPTTGKSTLCKKFYSNYTYINNDSQTKSKNNKLFNNAINSNNSIIIDNTNPSDDRETWIYPCQNNGYNISIIHMIIDDMVIKHLNIYRANINKKNKLSKIVYNLYKSKFKNPDDSEHCVYDVHFNMDNNDPRFMMKYVSDIHDVGPDGIDYAKMKLIDLRRLSKQRGLKGYTKYRKGELIKFMIENI